MQKVIRFQPILRRITHPVFLLFCSGTFGLILGTLFAAFADASVFSLMRQVSFGPVSIVVFSASQLLPFLIAAYAASISRLWLMHTVCFCKLFLFAYSGTIVWIAFDSAGWLVRSLLLFSQILLVPLLCWYCFRQVMHGGSQRNDLLICLGIAVITALCDCLFIAPFLAKII